MTFLSVASQVLAPASFPRIVTAPPTHEAYVPAFASYLVNQSYPLGSSGDQAIQRITSTNRARAKPVAPARRWSLHILPKGFVKVRNYGGFSNTKRKSYLQGCRQLLGLADDQTPNDHKQQLPGDSVAETREYSPACPHFQQPLTLLARTARPSWRETFSSSYLPPWEHDA